MILGLLTKPRLVINVLIWLQTVYIVPTIPTVPNVDLNFTILIRISANLARKFYPRASNAVCNRIAPSVYPINII